MKASTFHSLGRQILAQFSVKPNLSKLAQTNGPPVLETFIQKTITEKLKDPEYKKVMTRWFSEFFAPYKSEFDFENYGQYWEYIKKNQIITLKDEQVKSYEECEVANFLFKRCKLHLRGTLRTRYQNERKNSIVQIFTYLTMKYTLSILG